MDGKSYKKHITTVKELIEEVINITDDYKAKNVSEETLRYYIQFWATNSGGLLFYGEEGFNPTFVQRVGKRRLKLVDKMFDGMQISINR